MKLSSHPDDINYHPIGVYVKVLINAGRTELKDCISFDISTGEYCCYKYPIEVLNGEAVTYCGKDTSLTFEIPEYTPQWLIDDWYKRETK